MMRRLSLLACGSVLCVIAGLAPSLAQEDSAAPEAPETDAGQPKAAPRRAPAKPAPRPVAQTRPPAAPLVPAAAPATAPAAGLPNGASSISETYGDWTVGCSLEEGGKACLLSQAQGSQQTGQRTFVIELRAPREGRTLGTIVMPLGVKLEAGAILKLDDKDLGQGLRFSTCGPAGCFLPVALPSGATDAMKTAQRLTVAALNLNKGDAIVFNVSMKGFAAALARIAQLD